MNKKTIAQRIMAGVLVLIATLGIWSCASPKGAESDQIELRTPGTGNVIILHTNDMHGRLVTGSSDGMGLDRLASLVQQMRASDTPVLLLDAGDALHGQPATTLTKGEAMLEVMNLIGYEAFVPGNHDFNYGYERLIELSKLAKFPMLAANVTLESTGEHILPPYIIKEYGSLKVGIFGLATPDTYFMSNPDNTRGLKIDNPLIVAANMVGELQPQVDVIIALAHLGDIGEFSSIKLAENVDGIDLIVDGHSHSNYPEGKMVRTTLIVSAHEYNKNLGQVELQVVDGKIIKMAASLISKEKGLEQAPDQAVVDLIASINARQADLLAVELGSASVNLDGERATVRTRESAFGNLIADAYVAGTGADLALQNGGGIRTSIKAGPVTVNNVLTVFPFSNRLVVIELSGEKILAALEHSVRLFPEQNGGFMQIGGFRFSFDPSRPAGGRVNPASVRIKDQLIDTNKMYKVATVDFLSTGGDGYEMFKGAKVLSDAGDLTDFLADYFRKNSPVSAVVDGRISTGAW